MPFCELKYFSQTIQKHTAANIILPDPSVKGPWNVLFLLHGLSDDHTIWSRRTSIERYVDGLPLIVVMPDTARGFYADAVEGFAYNTAIGQELPEIIKTYFPAKGQWCVSGLSMGGYGAFRLAFDYPTLFTSATSHSGALAFAHLAPGKDDPRNAEFRRIMGDNPTGGPNDLHALSAKLPKAKRPKIRFDCGTEDFLLDHNRDFVRHLKEIGYEHEYEEFPGSHEWGYWDLHIQESIAFHRKNLGF